ncbi:MAG: hypothetical protein FJ115_12640 [Deltaproteobacteria bacterium]|nr:hypothetical protein [Deltaproteobacteria bacterium]MBM4324400.1 hypothetical protein [Deltaproteobacteria bacterium]
MQLLWLRRMPIWLAGPVLVMLVLGVVIHSHAQSVQTNRLPSALMYPDGKTVVLKYSRVEVEVSISGTHTERDQNRELKESLTLQARFTEVYQPKVDVRTWYVEGKHVVTEVDRGAKQVSTSTYTFALSDPRSTPRKGPYRDVAVSKKYGATNFGVEGPVLMWPDAPGHVVTKVRDSTGENTFEDKTICQVSLRIPYHSAVGSTPFAALVRQLEAAGKDGDDSLAGGIIEALWDKGGSFGSFSVPVLASGGGGSFYSINTKAAMVAEKVGPPLFPGGLKVTWVLDTKERASR